MFILNDNRQSTECANCNLLLFYIIIEILCIQDKLRQNNSKFELIICHILSLKIRIYFSRYPENYEIFNNVTFLFIPKFPKWISKYLDVALFFPLQSGVCYQIVHFSVGIICS